MPSSHLFQFLSGLAFAFYGLFLMHESLQNFAGDRFKNMIARTTESRGKSFITGMLATFFLQSSSVVTVMVVGLTSSGLLSLEQAMAAVLGAGVGTTFVVLLISVKTIVQNGLVIFVVGLVLKFLSQRRAPKFIGEVLMGFGLVFFGLAIMSGSTAHLKTDATFMAFIQFLSDYPLTTTILSACITAMVHSSSVMLGVVISIAFSGNISFAMAVPIILGVNVGTAFTGILASFKANTDGKRAAWSNMVFRFVVVCAVFPFLPLFVNFLHTLNVGVATLFGFDLTVYTEIALSHFFFNFLMAMIFLPLLPFGQKLIVWLIPTSKEEKAPFGPKYLDKNALSTPTLAFAQINREMMRMGDIVRRMFNDSLGIFKDFSLDAVDRIRSTDHQVDTLYKAIKFFLAKMAFNRLKQEETNQGVQLMSAVNELENIGDIIDRHIVRLAHKKWSKGVKFSNEGWKEICEMHAGTAEVMEIAMLSLSSFNEELAVKVKNHQVIYSERGDQLKMSHLKRLNQKRQESIDTSAIHLELLSLFNRINLALLSMVEFLLPEREASIVEELEED